MIRLSIVMLALAALGVMGTAQPDPDSPPWAKPYAGRWTLSGSSEGDPVCGLSLGSGLAIGGASVEVSATCRRNYPMEDVAGWAMQGKAIVLIDALRKPVYRFEPGPEKAWSTTLPGDRLVFLERGAPQKPANLKVLFGDAGTFTLSGPDNAGACGFAVTAATPTGGTLEQGGRCPSVWKSKTWKTWSAQGDALQLKDAKGAVVISLKRADEYTFVAEMPAGPVFFGPGAIEGSD